MFRHETVRKGRITRFASCSFTHILQKLFYNSSLKQGASGHGNARLQQGASGHGNARLQQGALGHGKLGTLVHSKELQVMGTHVYLFIP